jgi:hypothetical protein
MLIDCQARIASLSTSGVEIAIEIAPLAHPRDTMSERRSPDHLAIPGLWLNVGSPGLKGDDMAHITSSVAPEKNAEHQRRSEHERL